MNIGLRHSAKKTKMSDETLEFNRMQGDFLNDVFCLNFYQIAFPSELKERPIRSYETTINKKIIHVDLENPTGERFIWNKNFEKDKIDVSYSIAIEFENIKEAWDIFSLYNYSKEELDTTYITKALKIEIVPNVADDYPSVLGRIQKIKANCLYLQDYSGKGIDEQKFIEIFKQQSICVIFKRQLQVNQKII